MLEAIVVNGLEISAAVPAELKASEMDIDSDDYLPERGEVRVAFRNLSGTTMRLPFDEIGTRFRLLCQAPDSQEIWVGTRPPPPKQHATLIALAPGQAIEAYETFALPEVFLATPDKETLLSCRISWDRTDLREHAYQNQGNYWNSSFELPFELRFLLQE